MYRFKLEPLLRHRKHLEEDCQKELAVLREALDSEIHRLEELRQKLSAQEKSLQRLQSGRPDIPAIVSTIAYIRRLGQEIETQQDAVDRARKACDQQRLELVRAMKGRKIIEKLKEKGQAGHEAEERRIHQNFMNEIAINRFARNR